MNNSSASIASASASIDVIHPDGRRVPCRIWIGSPYQVDELEARCPCGVEGMLRPHDAIGGDTLQALMLAARLLALLLADFLEKGGRFVHPGTDEEFELEPYFGNWVRAEVASRDAEPG